jgi:hypothetical protein
MLQGHILEKGVDAALKHVGGGIWLAELGCKLKRLAGGQQTWGI